MDKVSSKITFRSEDEALNRGFEWAKGQALAYAHDGSDPVGLWYEAALPGRNAFCMRDVSHQSMGASVLGLQAHTRNMMQRFAENISKGKDYCTYWEITGDNVPAPVDYENDDDFWYNLPANFDVIEACYRQYLWTGDRSYLEDPVLQNFYRLSVTEYVKTWDKDGDGIPEYDPSYGRRGLSSYNEAGDYPKIGADLIALMIAGYQAYADMEKKLGNSELYAEYAAKTVHLRELLEQQWWDGESGCFFVAMGHDGTFLGAESGEGQFLPLYYEAIVDREKREGALREMDAQGVTNVEGMSYLPETYYRCGEDSEGLRSLKELMDPALERREYPEVSFAAVGAVVSGLMGISADGGSTVATVSRLTEELAWAEISEVSVLGRMVSVKHKGRTYTEFTGHSAEALVWRAEFYNDAESPVALLHNGEAVRGACGIDKLGRRYVYAEIAVAPGETHVISIA
ncbi:MGH1-like glycoside hydrolase domain-containing protein [Paenibacillus sp. PL91]|uniref:MGH1-like glycoside hydrolase domain-containing protein n=1 Tax=Paenibacillus sp. PL91 TaxID=2729538 RepID=UPI00145D2CDC|nr:hypothetical protein [Paenibacillus sp. PL91]MBC9200114.1 hypothetical protein [Paenibacillus sp. PL91]